jgi:HK97 family phage major capsid protein
MGPEQIRARLLEISNMLEGIQAGADGYTVEQVDQVNALNEEFEALTTQLEAAEKIEAMKAKATVSAGRKVEPKTASPLRVEVGASAKDKFGGFNSTGDFLNGVKRAAAGDIDKRFQNAMYEKNGEDGGFLVPEEMSSAILKKLESSESLMAATTSIPISGNSLTLNVDEAQPWNQGIQAYWLAESGALTESKNVFKQASWRLQKVGVLVKATEELLDDVTALEGYIKAAAPAAIMHKVNSAIISGNGAGKPQGIISSPFTVTVAAEGGQAADTIVARNVIKMYTRMIPSARAGAAWYINPACEAQLLTMKDDADNFIYLAPGSQMNQSPYGILMGRPVIPLMSGIPALGDLGDIMFANLSYYYMIQKAGGVKSATSIHLNFDREITAFRFTMRLDGKCPFTSPVTTEFGAHQMSAFVQLAAR